jgi:peroxiredoxin
MGFLTVLWRKTWGVRAAIDSRRRQGEIFPDFTMTDVSGRSHTLSGSRGLTVLWLTNLCEDCRSRVPLLREMVSAGLRVLAVSILPVDDPLPREFGKSAPFAVLLDPEDIVTRVLGLEHPQGTCPLHNLYIIDVERRILFRHHLSAVRPDEFRTAWRELAAQSGLGGAAS